MVNENSFDKETRLFYEKYVLPEFGIENTENVVWGQLYNIDENEGADSFSIENTGYVLAYSTTQVPVENLKSFQDTPRGHYEIIKTRSGVNHLDLSSQGNTGWLMTKGFMTLIRFLPPKKLDANEVVTEKTFYIPVFASEVTVRGQKIQTKLLSENENSQFASRIMPGETLKQAIKNDLKQHFGLTEEEAEQAGVGEGQEFDTALDKQGKETTRFKVNSFIPYLPKLEGINVIGIIHRWFIKDDDKYITLKSYTDTLNDASMPAYKGLALLLRENNCWWLSKSHSFEDNDWGFPALTWLKPTAEDQLQTKFSRVIGEVVFNIPQVVQETVYQMTGNDYPRIQLPYLFKINDYKIVGTIPSSNFSSVEKLPAAVVEAHVESVIPKTAFMVKAINTEYRLFNRQEIEQLKASQNPKNWDWPLFDMALNT